MMLNCYIFPVWSELFFQAEEFPIYKVHSVLWYEHANIFLLALNALCYILTGRTLCGDIVLYVTGNKHRK